MPYSPYYGYIKGRQLEGTFPDGPEVGMWPITYLRVDRGWGIVREEDYPFDPTVWPPTPPTKEMDELAKKDRIWAYVRVRNSEQCKEALAKESLVMASFSIHDQWFNAPAGVIEIPQPNEPTCGGHAVPIHGYSDPTGRFAFRNSWGAHWGDHGDGYLPYEYFDAFLTEAWIMIPPRELPSNTHAGVEVTAWEIPDPLGTTLHGIDIDDHRNETRIGWLFGVHRDEYLDVEEFFVRPDARRHGWGSVLIDELERLAIRLKFPVRFWISHVDSDPQNMDIVKRMLRRLDLEIVGSGVTWATYRGMPRNHVGVGDASTSVRSSAGSRPRLWRGLASSTRCERKNR